MSTRCRVFSTVCCFSFFLIFLWHGVTISFSHFPFSASFSFHRFQHTCNYPTVSLPFSHVSHRGQSLGFLSSSNTAVLHHDCNSSSACNSRPNVSQVIRPLPHPVEGKPPGHTLAHSLHVQSCAACLVIVTVTHMALAAHIRDHETGLDALGRPGFGVTARWIRQILI